MLKSLLMASALTMAFSGAAMAEDAPSVGSAGCTSCALPTSSAGAPVKMAQLGPVRGNPIQVGEAIPVPRGDQGGFNLCCPPIAGQKAKFPPMFRLQQSAGKNVTQTYGVTFMPSAELDTQLKAFTPFVGINVPSGLYGNSVHLRAEMRQLDEAPTVDVVSTDFADTAGDTVTYAHSLRAWWIPTTGSLAPSGIWNGPHAGPPAYNWENQFEDNRPSMAPNHMIPGKWYMVKLTWQVAMKNTPHGTENDRSWIVKDLNCTNMKPIYVRFMVPIASVNKMAGGAMPSAQSMARIEVVN